MKKIPRVLLCMMVLSIFIFETHRFSTAKWEAMPEMRKLIICDSHRSNISSVISGYKQPSKSAQSIEITGFIEKSKPPEIIFFYTLLPLTA